MLRLCRCCELERLRWLRCSIHASSVTAGCACCLLSLGEEPEVQAGLQLWVACSDQCRLALTWTACFQFRVQGRLTGLCPIACQPRSNCSMLLLAEADSAELVLAASCMALRGAWLGRLGRLGAEGVGDMRCRRRAEHEGRRGTCLLTERILLRRSRAGEGTSLSCCCCCCCRLSTSGG